MQGEIGAERFSERIRRGRAEHVGRAAARLLGEQGCFRLRVAEVARTAGVGKGTVYLDHRDKASLIGASLAHACRDVIDGLDRRTRGVADPRHRLLAAVRFLAEIPADRPDLTVLLEGRLACSARWIGADITPHAELVGRIRSIVEDVQAVTVPERPIEPELAAQAILAVAATPAWRRNATLDGPGHAVRQMTLLMPRLFPGADPADADRDAPEGPEET